LFVGRGNFNRLSFPCQQSLALPGPRRSPRTVYACVVAARSLKTASNVMCGTGHGGQSGQDQPRIETTSTTSSCHFLRAVSKRLSAQNDKRCEPSNHPMHVPSSNRSTKPPGDVRQLRRHTGVSVHPTNPRAVPSRGMRGHDELLPFSSSSPCLPCHSFDRARGIPYTANLSARCGSVESSDGRRNIGPQSRRAADVGARGPALPKDGACSGPRRARACIARLQSD
jgi:hypothetical protein